MLDLYAKNEPVDLVTVCALLKERSQLEGVGVGLHRIFVKALQKRGMISRY